MVNGRWIMDVSSNIHLFMIHASIAMFRIK
jgi:hypothetical protein